jgi:acyl-CoA thioester hydrolase
MRPEWTHHVELSPAFHDLDPMGIVWHGHYFKYFEIARCALLQRLDYDFEQMRDSGFAWPVVDLRTKYIRPLKYGQRLHVEARLTEWENRMRIDYVVRDADTGLAHTKAHTLQVAVEIATGEMWLVTPTVFRQRIGAAT